MRVTRRSKWFPAVYLPVCCTSRTTCTAVTIFTHTYSKTNWYRLWVVMGLAGVYNLLYFYWFVASVHEATSGFSVSLLTAPAKSGVKTNNDSEV